MSCEDRDVIIVGSGISALMLADKITAFKNVIILTKSKKDKSNSMLAQGGIAVSISSSDHWYNHFKDTLNAGCNHNDPTATKVLVESGPPSIQKLIDGGMQFDRDIFGELLLGMEGAHGKRRILHAGGDSTGKALVTYLLARLKDRVTIVEDEMVVDLIMIQDHCVGVITIDDHNQFKSYYAEHIVLATGGCGGLYSLTSNDPTITGDGIAVAYRAGAELADMEFVQFHPTMLSINGKGHGLISEAVRGEGARLVDQSGRSIMDGVHVQAELAPRDIIARTINQELSKGNSVFLNISMIKDFHTRFPTITSICEKAGISVAKGFLPVAPGAHFLMGGIKTNINGETSLKGLYAIGEVACTGVHGANRLASNSLLEGIVFSSLLAKKLLEVSDGTKRNYIIQDYNKYPKQSIILPTIQQIQEKMNTFAGIERDEPGLIQLKEWIESYIGLNSKVKVFIKDEIKIINMLTTSWLIVTSALCRTESRGGHYRNDYPLVDDANWGMKQVLIRIQKSLMAGVNH